MILQGLYRYPVKGLNGEALDRIALSSHARLPGDRRFALAHGSAPWKASVPRWLPPKHFYSLRSEPRLASLSAGLDPDSGVLTLERRGRRLARAVITEPLGRAMIGQFFADYLGPDGRGMPKLVEAEAGEGMTDVPQPWISLLNLASVEDLARVARRPVDPRRFRANLWIEGAAAWEEFNWVGRNLRIGTAKLRVMEPIERCAATNVDPDSATVDMNLPLLLRRGYQHLNMGVYCEVISDGEVAPGDTLLLD